MSAITMALLRKILSFLSVYAAETRYSSKDEAESADLSHVADRRRRIERESRDAFHGRPEGERNPALVEIRERTGERGPSRRARFSKISEIWLYVTFKINSSASAEPGANGSTIPRINAKEARMRSLARALRPRKAEISRREARAAARRASIIVRKVEGDGGLNFPSEFLPRIIISEQL